MSKKPAIFISRAYSAGCMTVTATASSFGGGVSAKATVSRRITAAEARELAAALIAEADRLDIKAAADERRKARREKWRQREIAAGRLVVMSPAEFFRR